MERVERIMSAVEDGQKGRTALVKADNEVVSVRL